MKSNIFLLSVALILSARTEAQTLMHSELLGRPTDNSITVQVIFSDSAEVSVQYGTVSGNYSNQTSWLTFADSIPATIVINGLQADTKYYYRVCYRAPGNSGFNTRPEFSFHTQRAAGSSYRFTVEADPHLDYNSDTALYRQCLQNQLEDNPDFMIDLGDFLMTDKLIDTVTHQVPFDTVPYRCHLFRSYYSTCSHSVPIYNVIGNHEGESGWFLDGSPNNVAIWDAQQRNKYFLNPAPDNFYSGDTSYTDYVGLRRSYFAWQWGDALFIVLDPYWYTNPKPDSLNCWRWSLGKNQYDWLKTTLEGSSATFKFVFAHHLVGGNYQGRGGVENADYYEWGGNNIDGSPGFAANRPGWYKPIKDLLTENRVNIFFHGHDHFFDEQQKDCLIYQETPQPSLPNFSYPNQAAQYGYLSGQIVGNSGHLRVTVSSTGTQVEYVRAFLPQDTDATHHNGDVSATYFIGTTNCYDSVANVSVIWNSNYANEIVYPNPFSHETKIEFSVKSTQKINLALYNETGKLVRQLIAGSTINPGRYAIVWDGKDYNDHMMSSGTYYYLLQGMDLNDKGKIVLVR